LPASHESWSVDGIERELTGDMLVIADAEKPAALAGVMGGRDSEVTDRTVNILLESARFDPLSIRSTARKLAMGSDSSYRYERGIDPTLPERASLRAVELILQTAGGKVTGPLVAAGSTRLFAQEPVAPPRPPHPGAGRRVPRSSSGGCPHPPSPLTGPSRRAH